MLNYFSITLSSTYTYEPEVGNPEFPNTHQIAIFYVFLLNLLLLK